MSIQGQESNHSGQFLERIVEEEARTRGFHVLDFSMDCGNTDLFHTNKLIRNCPYISIYGAQSRSEFVIVSDMLGRRVRVECRWQQCPGSVDEKFPYLFMNARDAMPEREVLLLIGGDGARTVALDWLRRKCQTVESKRIYVHTVPEFRQWFKRFTEGTA